MRKSFGSTLRSTDQPHRKESYVGRIATVGNGGRSIAVTNMNNSQLRNLVPITPYGIASSPPVGLMAYVLVADSASKDGIVGVHDPNRPQCSPGDSILYSSGGASVHCKGDKVLINGKNILQEISNGNGSSNDSSNSQDMTIPVATQSTIGGVIIGDGLEIDEDGKVKTCKHTHEWNDIENKPSTFEPSDHTHKLTDISGILSVSNGGTGQTLAYSDSTSYTNGTYGTIDNIRIRKFPYINMCCIRLSITTSKELTAGNTYTILTVGNDCKPQYTTAITAMTPYKYSALCAYITSGCLLRVIPDINIPVGETIRISAWYILD